MKEARGGGLGGEGWVGQLFRSQGEKSFLACAQQVLVTL